MESRKTEAGESFNRDTLEKTCEEMGYLIDKVQVLHRVLAWVIGKFHKFSIDLLMSH
jgi:hypothetical protein